MFLINQGGISLKEIDNIINSIKDKRIEDINCILTNKNEFKDRLDEVKKELEPIIYEKNIDSDKTNKLIKEFINVIENITYCHAFLDGAKVVKNIYQDN